MKQDQFDKIGIVSSFLCLIHCLIVPIGMVFAYEFESLHHSTGWTLIQVLFIGIAAWAVRHAVRHTQRAYIRIGLWLGVGLLVLALFLPHGIEEVVNYSAAGLLVLSHTLNLFTHSHKPSVA